ncbi:MAG: NADH-quinone oxidoreductase subunit C [Acidobacteria bacterium]|nr:MAG: NADH-quinone oxidoreductase subunit C [Acidobacteriota bacterium]
MTDKPEKPKAAPKVSAKKPVAPSEPPPITDDPIIDRLRQRFPEAVLEAIQLDWPTLRIARDHILQVCRFLRDDAEAQFDFLTDVTGRHIPDAEKPFQVIYHLYSFPRNARLRLKVDLGQDETIPSVVEVWSGANWMEREVYDLFGIRFENHPDLRRLLLPEDWEGHPLRKDYPLLFRYNRWTKEHLNMIPFDPEGEYTGRFE